MLKEFLNNIVAEYVGHQLHAVAHDLFEDDVFLLAGSAFELPLDETRAVLVAAELDHVAKSIPQVKFSVRLIIDLECLQHRAPVRHSFMIVAGHCLIVINYRAMWEIRHQGVDMGRCMRIGGIRSAVMSEGLKRHLGEARIIESLHIMVGTKALVDMTPSGHIQGPIAPRGREVPALSRVATRVVGSATIRHRTRLPKWNSFVSSSVEVELRLICAESAILDVWRVNAAHSQSRTAVNLSGSATGVLRK